MHVLGGPLGEWYSQEELNEHFAAVGENVLVSRGTVFVGSERIRIGSCVRIDSFGFVNAGEEGIDIGDHVHIALGCYLIGSSAKITFEPFSGLASRGCVFTANDDYIQGALTNPTVPDEYKLVTTGPVLFGRHALVGCGSVVMPGTRLGIGCSVGALSFVNRDVPDFAIAIGNPLRIVGKRDRSLLERETEFLQRRGSIQNRSR